MLKRINNLKQQLVAASAQTADTNLIPVNDSPAIIKAKKVITRAMNNMNETVNTRKRLMEAGVTEFSHIDEEYRERRLQNNTRRLEVETLEDGEA